MGYRNLNGIDSNDFGFFLSLEKAHLEFDTVIGKEDNTTGFFGAQSSLFNVPAGKTVSTQFVNYTDLGANWDNFMVALVDNANANEYAVVRADNFGWGNGYDACTHECSQTDWATWLNAMDGAMVNVSVTNVGDGTANIFATILGTDGVTYTQSYKGINTINPDDLYFKLSIEKDHLVFDLPFSVEKVASAKARAKYRHR